MTFEEEILYCEIHSNAYRKRGLKRAVIQDSAGGVYDAESGLRESYRVLDGLVHSLFLDW